jgi:glutaredoxin
MSIEHVSGKNAGHMILYALSTCVWCRKTKQLLDDLGVEYDYVYVDLLDGNEKDHVIKTIEQWNPSRSFPTLESLISDFGIEQQQVYCWI